MLLLKITPKAEIISHETGTANLIDSINSSLGITDAFYAGIIVGLKDTLGMEYCMLFDSTKCNNEEKWDINLVASWIRSMHYEENARVDGDALIARLDPETAAVIELTEKDIETLTAELVSAQDKVIAWTQQI
jgi:hypothetical protein